MAFKSHKLLLLLAALLLIAVVATEAARTLDDSAKAGEGGTEDQRWFLRNLQTYFGKSFALSKTKTYCDSHPYYSYCKAKAGGAAYTDYKGAYASSYSSVHSAGGKGGYAESLNIAKKGR